MRPITLTQICINHIRTMTMAYVPDCELKHRNCSGTNEQCDDYRPYTPNYQLPVRQGKVCYELERIRE